MNPKNTNPTDMLKQLAEAKQSALLPHTRTNTGPLTRSLLFSEINVRGVIQERFPSHRTVSMVMSSDGGVSPVKLATFAFTSPIN